MLCFDTKSSFSQKKSFYKAQKNKLNQKKPFVNKMSKNRIN